MPAAGSEHGREVAFAGRPGFWRSAMSLSIAKDGVPGGEIAQRLDGVEAEYQVLDEVREERSGLVVLGAVGCKPFMVVVLAKGVQEGEDGRELGSWDRSMVFWL